MNKSRIEAFSDGVLAIIITIMVLELHAPHEATFAALTQEWPRFLSYLLSFIYVGIYWNNHHHLFQIVKEVRGRVLWANLHLLFWLSLVPFATAWSDETSFAPAPVATYGFVLFMASVAYYLLVRSLMAVHGQSSELALAVGSDRKGVFSSAVYLVGIALTFVSPFAGLLAYVVVALIWLVPDLRLE